ncbi:hypothetical protein [Porcipelethomonas sp.]|uniref:hypothetical protein n=1 Tax=Porcipelethomonas sp. TaxID=2981675 RepID=UPI003EF5A1A2
MTKKIRSAVFAVLITVSVYFCLRYPESIGKSITDSIERCLKIIIPSMFMFMCVSSVISASGLHRLIGRPFRPFAEKILKIPEEGFAVFILSMISGYPAGIKLVSDSLTKGEITVKQAQRMNCFCFSSGPAFISGTAAGLLYPDSNTGIIIFCSVVLGNLAAAVVSGLMSGEKYQRPGKSKISLNEGSIIPSVKSASAAMMQMCIMIVAFGGFCCILKLTGIIQFVSVWAGRIFSMESDEIYNIIMTFLEISNVVTLPVMDIELMPVITMLLSFGGVCVLMQIISIGGDNFNTAMFLKYRIIAAAVSAAACRFLMRFSDITDTCGASFEIVSENKYSPLPSVLLIIMIIMLLGTAKDSGGKKSSE